MAGKIVWIDLTVEHAESTRDFYANVLGWEAEPVSMGSYSDYNMLPAEGEEPVAGVCHARGPNQGVPPVWMLYVTVEDLGAAMEQCTASGGTIVRAPTEGGSSCIIRDPAGAVLTLYQE